jgi:hypothetical protein
MSDLQKEIKELKDEIEGLKKTNQMMLAQTMQAETKEKVLSSSNVSFDQHNNLF